MADQSIWYYFVQAGPVVKMVLLLIVMASIQSWAFIFQRGWQIFQLKNSMLQFNRQFESTEDLAKLYLALNKLPNNLTGLAGIFHAGFKEYVYLHKQGKMGTALLEAVQLKMTTVATKEIAQIEKNLPILATIGSVSPYIGLFGTVWGIMTSFQALGSSQQLTLAMVAPGIAEALIATAMGLFAAIPAVIAYNRYSYYCQQFSGDFSLFIAELISILSEQANASQS